MTYSAAWETLAGVEIAVLRDTEAEAEVRVAPALGNTCVGFRLGDWRVLDEPPNETELREHAGSYGIPVLFPWPNRVRDARFTFEGREYRLPPAADEPNAIHGLVRDRPWQPTRCEADAEAALVRSEIRSPDFPELADQYPSAFELSLTYALRRGRLEIEAFGTNVGDGPLPFGFGLHPYFPVPLGPGGRRESCELRVPAAEVWELGDYLPSGRRFAADGRYDLRDFRALDRETYDDVLTALEQPFRAALRDPVAGREIVVEADAGFREFVLFAPSRRSIVALEPYTCATDALNLEPRGIDAGLRALQPGQSWQGRVTIEPRS